ncbi:Rv3235 family protein [Kitasatospora sp. NPDC094015]|uniref:Rv3235 family protein n=1 Tax=Kitasatospora sp. NPDC094015 TaxID=3155205 RepID=UPI00331FCF98
MPEATTLTVAAPEAGPAGPAAPAATPPVTPAPVAAPAPAVVPQPAPRVRPLVPAPGRQRPRRPVRHPHPVTACTTPAAPHARAAPPRTPRHPRAACAPAQGAGQGELATRFAHRLVEVLTGARPVGQLQRHTTLRGYQQIVALVRSGPLRPHGRPPRTRLGRVYDSAPGSGALEVCVRVEFGPRHHMVAFRLEQHRQTQQWQCAAVEAR